MFTGIISKTSKVKNVKPKKDSLSLEIQNNLVKVALGEGVSVNGVCSTVKKAGKVISFEYMPETLRLTNLGDLKKDDTVNLEQSLRLGDRLSGHMMLGHIDGMGKIIDIKKEGNSQVLEIRVADHKFMKFIVYKGSVALEGVSLTVTKVSKNSFFVKLLPYTLNRTNLKNKRKGDNVNLEFDILAKYADKRQRKK